MEFRTHWKFDNFYPGAAQMRQVIDDHFTESIAHKQPFNKRAVWNYWYIPTLYAYFRAHPAEFFDIQYENFMGFLNHFTAREFGLVIASQPFLSMYINGCQQNIHNDATNGRLAYVYSLTNWEARHFIGGETFVYHVGDASLHRIFTPTGGWGFYDFIEPAFNRLGLFDDRLPHAVNKIEGTMNPLDARFALHGHVEEPDAIAYIEGDVQPSQANAVFAGVRDEARRIFSGGGCHGFVTFDVALQADGAASAHARHMQLIPKERGAQAPAELVALAAQVIASTRWPAANGASRMVMALGSAALR